MKNRWREFVKRSKHISSGDYLLILTTFLLDDILKLIRLIIHLKVAINADMILLLFCCFSTLSFVPQVDRENLWFGIIPRISFADKETYVESETKQYDMVS